MKELLSFLFSKQPRVYQNILRLRANPNFEKILFLNVVLKGDVVFDIGANRGYYTLLFSHLAGRTGEVHAFEPVSRTFHRLVKSIASVKRFDNVYLNNVAVGDVSGLINLYLPGDDDGQASMKAHSSGSWSEAGAIETFECKIIRLDDYVESARLNRLDFVKCDVEGAELFALKGLARTLSKFSPVLYLEICPDWTRNFNYSPPEITEFLMSFGYSTFHLINNTMRPLSDPGVELSSDNYSGSANLLCTIPKLHAPRLNYLIRKCS